jgi:hypothetical protein
VQNKHSPARQHTHTHKQRENVSFDMLCAHSHRHAPDAVQTRADGPCRIERSTGTVKKVGSERRGGREEEKVREERREADAPPDSSRPLLLQQQPQRPMPILPILEEIRRRAFCASASCACTARGLQTGTGCWKKVGLFQRFFHASLSTFPPFPTFSAFVIFMYRT